jgi:ketosteroid isomerase-like protein
MATETRAADALETGTAFAKAYADADYAEIEAQLDPDVGYREITPSRVVEATGPAAILDEEREFLERYDRHETLELEVERVGERVAARTRWRLHRGGETEVVEWCEYMTVRDGRVTTLDAVCSGPMPER